MEPNENGKASKNNRREEVSVLLVLDEYYTHTENIDVIDLARRNDVHLITLPPYCTHKIQAKYWYCNTKRSDISGFLQYVTIDINVWHMLITWQTEGGLSETGKDWVTSERREDEMEMGDDGNHVGQDFKTTSREPKEYSSKRTGGFEYMEVILTSKNEENEEINKNSKRNALVLKFTNEIAQIEDIQFVHPIRSNTKRCDKKDDDED
ncbi:hypothetical protein FQA39_LY16026 [Lamprigera yunnana]|nr:hypothetical protein FQA39_LY16026 [Lamprigera yunnana]